MGCLFAKAPGQANIFTGEADQNDDESVLMSQADSYPPDPLVALEEEAERMQNQEQLRLKLEALAVDSRYNEDEIKKQVVSSSVAVESEKEEAPLVESSISIVVSEPIMQPSITGM